LPDASSKIDDLQGPQSSTSTQRIGNKNEKQKEPQYEAHQQEAIHDHNPSIHQYSHAGRKENTKGNNLETQSSMTFHKRQSIYREYKFPDGSSGEIRMSSLQKEKKATEEV
jgi:hypothetical protein